MHSRARKLVSLLLIVLIGLGPMTTGAVAGSNHCEADTSGSTTDSLHAGHNSEFIVERATGEELAQACTDCDEGFCSLGACQDNACGPNVFALVSRSEFPFRKSSCSLSSAQQRLAYTERISSPYRPPRA